MRLGWAVLFFLSWCAGAQAQDQAPETKGVDSGNYNVQQTIDFGYRLNEVGGNQDTYDTFVNLQAGVRLFDYTLDMRSLNHNGLLFDNLHFSNFGYGGDPDDVSRLHVDKNKWYGFDVSFRRHENFWDYNLLANPLNPATLNPPGSLTTGCYVGPLTTAFPQGAPAYCSTPANAALTSPHSLNLVRRMQDYDLLLFPQSRLRFRLGFSHDRDEGPGFLTGDIGAGNGQFPESFSYTTNAYRAGVDVRFLPRTTISYDQFLNYFKQDNSVLLSSTATPGLFGYQANGTLVNMGLVWSNQTPAQTLPCANTIANAGTSPPTVASNCNGYVYYSQQAGRPRDFTPTELLRFESRYFQNFEMSGGIGYSTSSNPIPDFNELLIGWTTRTQSPGSTGAGPAKATRVSVDANWSGVYAVTDRFRIEDFFRYYNWRIPGLWNSSLGSLFNTLPGGAGLGAPVGAFVATNCAGTNFVNNEATCPNHTATSAADLVNAFNWNFLKQDMKTNTFKLDYEFTRRVSAYLGYLYDHRQIVSSSLTYTTADIYYPGGATGTAANFYLAARGNCTLVAGVLPAGCVSNADGSVTFTLAAPTTGPVYDSLGIDEHALLAGVVARPTDTLRVSGDLTWGYNTAAYTRISPRQVQSYNVHAAYTPKPWASLDGTVEINENRNNVETVNNLEHDRTYAFTGMLSPNPRLAVSLGYNYWDVYSQADVCFNFSMTYTNPAPPPATLTAVGVPPGVNATVNTALCPTVNYGTTNALSALSTYSSHDHFAHGDVMWKPAKRVTTDIGYGGSFVRGTTIFINPLTPSGTLNYNYQMPYASVTIDVYKGFSYKTAWNYYGFNETGVTNPFGLAIIPLQDFNGSNLTFSFRYAF